MIKINLYGIYKFLFGKKKMMVEDKMMLKSRCISNGKFEVNGVIFYADTHAEALRKYRRAKS